MNTLIPRHEQMRLLVEDIAYYVGRGIWVTSRDIPGFPEGSFVERDTIETFLLNQPANTHPMSPLMLKLRFWQFTSRWFRRLSSATHSASVYAQECAEQTNLAVINDRISRD